MIRLNLAPSRIRFSKDRYFGSSVIRKQPARKNRLNVKNKTKLVYDKHRNCVVWKKIFEIARSSQEVLNRELIGDNLNYSNLSSLASELIVFKYFKYL